MSKSMVSLRACGSTGLFGIAIVSMALATSCGTGDRNASNGSNLDRRNQQNNSPNTDPMQPEDPRPDDPMPTDPHDCNDPEPPPQNECERSGAICLPLDETGMLPPCPDGLFELALGCPFDEMTNIASVCCGFSEDPGPGPGPMDDPCTARGGVCWEADESGNVACPEGLEPSYETPCFIEDGSGAFSVCCAFVDYPPPPPPDECPDRNDPSVRYLGDSPEVCDAIEYLCPEGSAFISPCGCGCFERPDEPPPPPPDEERCPDANDPNVIYVSADLAVCNTISYTCPSNHVVFTSPCGCGCLGY